MTNQTVSRLFSRMTVEMLCKAFEETNNNQDSHISTVRGWIMDELELRDKEAFDKWIDSDIVEEIDRPSLFFK